MVAIAYNHLSVKGIKRLQHLARVIQHESSYHTWLIKAHTPILVTVVFNSNSWPYNAVCETLEWSITLLQISNVILSQLSSHILKPSTVQRLLTATPEQRPEPLTLFLSKMEWLKILTYMIFILIPRMIIRSLELVPLCHCVRNNL